MVAFGSALAALSITAAALFGAGLRDAILALSDVELSSLSMPEEVSAASGPSVSEEKVDSRIHDVVDVLGKLLEHKPTCVCNVQSEKVGSCVDDPRFERTTLWPYFVVQLCRRDCCWMFVLPESVHWTRPAQSQPTGPRAGTS